MELLFHKVMASGNDFIVIDNRKKCVQNASEFAKKFCAFHTGVGADGVLLVEKANTADFLMRIINSDGSEAEACGNGFRAIGLYAHQILGFSKTMKFETLSGRVELEIKASRHWHANVRVRMIDPFDYRKHVTLKRVGGKQDLTCAFINTGVPHAVIFTNALAEVDVETIGRAVRHHDTFAPRGANVNFVEVTGKNEMSIRTFERGVEGETLACGTGTVAAGVIAGLTGRVTQPVHILTKGGETLAVDFEIASEKVQNVYLTGGAEIVFEGKLIL